MAMSTPNDPLVIAGIIDIKMRLGRVETEFDE